MSIEDFIRHFPEIGGSEMRTLTLNVAAEGVPTGTYAYLESYCTDPTCDCQRVLLNVVSLTAGLVAVIGYGFDRNGPMPGPYLDLMNPQASYAEGILRLTERCVLADSAYVERLKRHYQMIKAKIAGSQPAGSTGRRYKRDKKKRRR